MEKEVLSPPHSHHSCPLVEGTLHILGKLQSFFTLLVISWLYYELSSQVAEHEIQDGIFTKL